MLVICLVSRFCPLIIIETLPHTPRCICMHMHACTHTLSLSLSLSLSLLLSQIYLKSTIPLPPEGAFHFKIMLWKLSRSLLLLAMVDSFSLLAPVKEQSRVCWLLFCGMKLPRSMWSSPGIWAVTRNPRKVALEPFNVTAPMQWFDSIWCWTEQLHWPGIPTPTPPPPPSPPSSPSNNYWFTFITNSVYLTCNYCGTCVLFPSYIVEACTSIAW